MNDDNLSQIIDKALNNLDKDSDGYINWSEYKTGIPEPE